MSALWLGSNFATLSVPIKSHRKQWIEFHWNDQWNHYSSWLVMNTKTGHEKKCICCIIFCQLKTWHPSKCKLPATLAEQQHAYLCVCEVGKHLTYSVSFTWNTLNTSLAATCIRCATTRLCYKNDWGHSCITEKTNFTTERSRTCIASTMPTQRKRDTVQWDILSLTRKCLDGSKHNPQ